MKRLLSLLLCITLTVSMLPLSAFAEDILAENSYEIYMDSSVMKVLPAEDRLFAGYMHQRIYGQVSTFGTADTKHQWQLQKKYLQIRKAQ